MLKLRVRPARSDARSLVRSWFERRQLASPWENDDILRDELFSIERLEQHAASLAAAQVVCSRPIRRPALGMRLGDNEAVLLGAYRDIARAVDEGRSITPAAEWLLDNYHIVESQIREIREDLPPGFYRQLPKLAGGPLAGYPRVLGLVWAYVAHTDSHFDPETLRRFVQAYQRVQPLTIGELWAVAITLRILLVENLRRAADRIVSGRAARQDADAIADQLLAPNGQALDPIELLRHCDPAVALPRAFIVQLEQRLREQDPKVTPVLRWLDEHLAALGTNAEAVVRDELQRQGGSNVTVRNIVTSMRLISELEWSEFFESVSLVDDTLRSGESFAQMDFATRNLYRSAIEDLGRGSTLTEQQIALAVVAAAQSGAAADPRRADAGYHLIGSGRPALERTIHYRRPWSLRPRRWIHGRGAGAYIGAVVVLAAALLAVPLVQLDAATIAAWQLLLLACIGLVPALDLAVALVNRVVTAAFGATLLPGLELRNGVPAEWRTLVAVPTLLTTADAIREQLERLEIHYLASPEGAVHFALLSDWVEAADEHAATDDALLALAADGIEQLNRRNGPMADGPRFLLLHRRRVWCAVQRQWMGLERKRGKLHELNRLLRGATDTTFLHVVDGDGGQQQVPAGVRFVITLDGDTRLPRDAVRRLIGKLAHPLNRPRFDAATGRVVEGHGVLQPRVTPSLPMGREGSIYQRVSSSAPGLDPYAAAISDVYQDLFGEGSYAGKGIYDVDAFESALAGRVPDGTLLSHDLFEGVFARAGLVSDIEVVEDFPARYDVAAARQHRWARGDWQLLPWLCGRAHATSNAGQESGLPLLGRWKMLDNLRRTLSAPAALAALLAGWTLPPRAALPWTLFVLGTLAVPYLLPALAAVLPRRTGITARSHLRALRRDAWLAAQQILMHITFLAHQAWLMADAIARTLYRLLVSHRDLLEWITAAQVTGQARLDLAGVHRRMAGGLLLAGGAALVVAFAGRDAAWLATPFILAWLASPSIALWISKAPRLAKRMTLGSADALGLRQVARRTWRYFETFVTAADHHLPPDNFQEDPHPVVAHRTSPTNLGLYLLSTASARDFGWMGTVEAAERLEATLATMQTLQRFRGHFYNWYDTRDLRTLEPYYVSSVDSGNLAAHLIAVASAAGEWRAAPVASHRCAVGATDALRLAALALRDFRSERLMPSTIARQLEAAIPRVMATLRAANETDARFATRLHAAATETAALADLAGTLGDDGGGEACRDLLFWCEAAQRTVQSWQRDTALSDEDAAILRQRLLGIETVARSLADDMKFDFLLDPRRGLLSIGYRIADGALDPSCYDLLASEARLASFIAIAKGDVAARHWFRLGRPVTPLAHGAGLVSWSGSMFEYLMPSLVMRAPAGSLLEQTSRLIVQRQIDHGEDLGLPWGMSESAYNARDLEFTYQYSNFGVPGLGLKRGLRSDSVVAPYATALAAMVEPAKAARNLERLTGIGALGRFGYYEAIDYTPSRLPDGATLAIVRAFMAHHQGMTIVAIANVLLHGIVRRRFHAEPRVQATELLLQERTPRDLAVVQPRVEETEAPSRLDARPAAEARRLGTGKGASPQVHLLSNGRYAVMVTAAGSGYSHWQDLAVTRWREDATRDDWGSYIYLRDTDTGQVWSAGSQPCGTEPDAYEAVFAEDRARFTRRDDRITTSLEIVVSPEEDSELRYLAVTNGGNRAREFEVTSYAEVVLAPRSADDAHPAFSKLFVQTEYVARHGAILATRRRRAADEREIWAAHQAVVEGQPPRARPEFETDRARFLGRGHEVRAPLAVMDGRRLSNTTGTVLDPVFAIRHRIRIAAGATIHIAFWTAVAPSRDALLELLDRHHDGNAVERVGTLAWTQAQVQLRHIGIDAIEAALYQQLAGHVIYANAALRPPSGSILRGAGGRGALWSQGISGDRPIVLLRIDDTGDLPIARQLLAAHEYWRMKGLAVDLIILNERATSYVQDLQIALETLARKSRARGPAATGATGGAVFLLRTDLIQPDTRALLSAVARVVLVAQRGSLADQLERTRRPVAGADRGLPPGAGSIPPPALEAPPAGELEFFNGLGGFADDGREYVVRPGPGQSTPAPWINVIANPAFGCQVAAEGGGFAWSINSRENQLTAWSNDPVTDRPGDALYLRDEDSGEVWGPTAAPLYEPGASYTIRHGQGYSRFEHESRGIALEFTLFVPLADPLRISRLRIHNRSGRRRRLSVTAYVEWVLGTSRAASAPFVATQLDDTTGALFARNRWNINFGSRVAFADLAGRQTEWSGDRREFLGSHGTLAAPAALFSALPLSGRVGAGLDPCGALRTTLEIAPGDEAEVVFLLGEAADDASAQSLLVRYREADLAAVLGAVVAHWDDLLGVVQVSTPERSMDLMLNRWLLYQALACRVWARSGFYQASGAYGFRDQLQDGMALAIARPALTREHLLRAASRQFAAGDVQHWWLPPTGQGVRTRISDDAVWLAHATAHYVATTGDTALLATELPFIEGPTLQPGEHDVFFQPSLSDESASLYEHCARGLDRSLECGVHGLPLIGTGDWNDGMNRVGELGRGESVWLGWFLYATLEAFLPLARERGDAARDSRWRAHATRLREALEAAGWDGEWYRRGFFDDGTPLGSAASDECRIDSIAQSWAVISGAADPARAAQAMAAVNRQLVERDGGLALLFAPPFDRSAQEPGYIKGYPPGIRENGGQYTHAAVWSVIAFALLGQPDTAFEVFSMLNPVNRTTSRAGVRRYKVEPYAIAADVYSVAPHVGRGGWTWYTGSAGWMYRAGLEYILGFRLCGQELLLTPCIPAHWPGFGIVFRYRSARYEIRVENLQGDGRAVHSAELDGQPLAGRPVRIGLVDDGATHSVRLTLGTMPPAASPVAARRID